MTERGMIMLARLLASMRNLIDTAIELVEGELQDGSATTAAAPQLEADADGVLGKRKFFGSEPPVSSSTTQQEET